MNGDEKAASRNANDDILDNDFDSDVPDPDTILANAPEEKISIEKLLITEEITDLVSGKNIFDSISKFKADSPEKEIALEFVNSHVLFLKEIVDSDTKKGINRSDAEIRDLVSHINIMLRRKDEFLFHTIVVNSPVHYKNTVEKNQAEQKKKDK